MMDETVRRTLGEHWLFGLWILLPYSFLLTGLEAKGWLNRRRRWGLYTLLWLLMDRVLK